MKPAHIEELTRDSFLRERIRPSRGDFFYLHLSDLLLALQKHSSDERLRILDFGCGGSPYRLLFPNADYLRADVTGAEKVDFEIGERSAISALSASFDVVLSTQVLEHCLVPQDYLRECHRVLKPSGKLILATHGLFEEHGCPLDFHRWTDDGLRALLIECAFEVESVTRVTIGPRAAFQLLQSALSQHERPKSKVKRALLWPLWRVLLARRAWNGLLDGFFSQYRVSDGARLPGDNFYLDLLAVARVPK